MRSNVRSSLIHCGLILLIGGYPGAASRAAAQDRNTPLVEGILTASGSADVVCLGEDHGRQHDSDLRLALVRHPKFPRVVDVIVVEFANPVHQSLQDRFILTGGTPRRSALSVSSVAREIRVYPCHPRLERSVCVRVHPWADKNPLNIRLDTWVD